MTGREDCLTCQAFERQVERWRKEAVVYADTRRAHVTFFAVWSPYVKHIKSHAKESA